MTTVKIGYGNLCDSSTLSGGSWTGGHPLTEIQTRELARYAQSSTADAADTQIIMDHGNAKAAQVFGIIAHTVDAAATITITRGTTSGGSDVYAGSAVACWPFTPIDGVYNGSHFVIWVVVPFSTTARYTKIAISGSQVIRIGRLFVGPMLDVEYNPEHGKYQDEWQQANSTIDRTESGADWVTTRTELRSVPFSYSIATHAQASLIHEVLRTHSITGEIAFVASTQDRAVQQQYGFLGTLKKLSALEYPRYSDRSISLAIDERGGAP